MWSNGYIMKAAAERTAATVTHLPGAERLPRPDLEVLRDRLTDDRGNWTKIAKAAPEGAGVSYHTLIRFANGEVKKPWGPFLRKLTDYYARQDELAKPARRSRKS